MTNERKNDDIKRETAKETPFIRLFEQ